MLYCSLEHRYMIHWVKILTVNLAEVSLQVAGLLCQHKPIVLAIGPPLPQNLSVDIYIV